MKNIIVVTLLSIYLIGCGGGSSTSTPPPQPPPADTWPTAEVLISGFMDIADATLLSEFETRYNATVSSLANQGSLYSGVVVEAVHADAELEINQFITNTHDLDFTIAITNRIDEVGMTALMNAL